MMPFQRTGDPSATLIITAITTATRGTSGTYPLIILALGLFVATAITTDVHGRVVSAAVLEQSAHADRVRELAVKLRRPSSALLRCWKAIFG
jgi:hypothetical protein